MRKITHFKISSHQKDILRKLLRNGALLRQAGFSTQLEVNNYILEAFSLIEPAVVYEFNQDAHWQIDTTSTVYKEMFSACAVTLGTKVEDFLKKAEQEGNPKLIVAGTILLEFLKTALTFVNDLVKDQAAKEEYEILDLEFVYLPPFGISAPPKIFRESPRLDASLVAKTLPIILEKLNATKINLTLTNGTLNPIYSTVFLVPWQKARKKGKK